MKKNLLLLSILSLMVSPLLAQKTLHKSAHLWEKQPTPTAVLQTGALPIPDRPNEYSISSTNSRTDTEVQIGNTVYDLQSNNSVATRLHNDNGNLSAIWTQGFEATTGFPNRGTGYNFFDGSEWGDLVDQRIEADIRTGWPCIDVTDDGKEVIVNHIFQAPFRLHSLTSDIGANTWTEMDPPNATTDGVIWPRMAIGGADGNDVHVIALTTPVANGGMPYEGVDGHILYYRSPDGGETWDIQDAIIPGLDNTAMVAGTADSYAIDANGETIVVVHFGQFHDVDIFKSTDNGETWTETTIFDFPLELYNIDDGYTANDIPPFDSLSSPDPLAILTSDNAGTVVLDNNDLAHVFFGRMYVSDEDLTDGGSTFFPATSGLLYWNESYGEDSTRLIADVVDANGNGTLDVADISEIGSYFCSLTTFPSAGVDAENNIYLSYSGLTEDFIKPNATPNQQHLRHLYAMASNDNGETWTTPYDLINEDISIAPDLIEFSEAVFPSVAKLVDNKMHLIYQLDFEPGLAVRGDLDIAQPNIISYIGLDTDFFGFTDTEDDLEAIQTMKVSPNPANDFLQIELVLSQPSEMEVSIYNIVGQLVLTQDLGKQAAGLLQTKLNLKDLSKGTYFVELKVNEERKIQKIVRQ